MMRRELLGLLSAGVGLLALPGCNAILPKRHTFRFRMTVEVDTPQGLKSGSSVMELSVALATFKLPDSAAVDLHFQGEAVPIDLPGGTLFALVGDRHNVMSFVGTIIDSFDPSHPRAEELVELAAELGTQRALGRTVIMAADSFPSLVRFRDIREPRTIELVDPNEIAKSFGPGVKLKRIFLTIVNEPVTTGIEKRFRWWGDYYQRSFDGAKFGIMDSTSNDLAAHISIGDFQRGDKK